MLCGWLETKVAASNNPFKRKEPQDSPSDSRSRLWSDVGNAMLIEARLRREWSGKQRAHLFLNPESGPALNQPALARTPGLVIDGPEARQWNEP